MVRLRLFSIVFLALGSQSLAQTTWYVDVNAGPGGNGTVQAPFDTIQGGVGQASTLSGDTLLVLPGQYMENINYLGKDLSLRSTTGAANTIIVGQGGSVVSLFNGESAAVIDGFTIREGTGTFIGPDRFGGGIYGIGTSFTVESCEILSNNADYGGGIFANGGGTISVLSTTVNGNQAHKGAGFHVNDISLLIDGCTVNGNLADQSISGTFNEGGGLWSGPSGNLTVLDTDFRFNRASFGTWLLPSAPKGGGVYTETPNALFRDCLFGANVAGHMVLTEALGGGVYCEGPIAALPVFENCIFTNNRALNGRGGAIYGSGHFQDCTLGSNNALYGGGIYVQGSLTMANSTISDNNAAPVTGECIGEGGGAYGGTYTDCTFSNNYAFFSGGGAYAAQLTNCTIRDNRVSGNCNFPMQGGGGISFSTATDCLIEQNQAQGTADTVQTILAGGGAYSSTLIRCDVLNNTVRVPASDGGLLPTSGFGGGTYNSGLTDCLVQGNVLEAFEDHGGQGGGIYGGSATNTKILDNRATRLAPGTWPALGGGAAKANLTRCILVGNEAGSGGAVWSGTMTNCSVAGNTATFEGGAVSTRPETSGERGVSAAVRNSILWGNSPSEVFVGNGTVTVTYSDVEGSVMPGLGNISSDPLFWNGPLGDVELQAASPCIDTGNPASPPDPDGSIVDMGAVPFDGNYAGTPIIYCTAKLNSLNCLPNIGTAGTPSTGGNDDFFLLANNLINQKPTIAIWGSEPAAQPFMGGTLCLGPPIQRTPTMSSGGTLALPDCTGTGSFHFSQSYMVSKSVLPGDRIYAQFWQRDPAHSDGTGTGLTDAVGFTVIP